MLLDYMAPTSSSNDSSLETDHSFPESPVCMYVGISAFPCANQIIRIIFFKKR